MVDNNFIIRMLSSIVILFIFSFATYFSDLSFYLLIFSIAVLSSFEWYNLTQGNKILYVFALLLIALPSASLIYLYNLPQGKYALVWFVLTIWGIDVMPTCLARILVELKFAQLLALEKLGQDFLVRF